MIDKIRNRLASMVKCSFHYLGFIIEKVPDEGKLYFELNNSHEAVQKYVLKRLTDNIRIANNHRLYNGLLKNYVPKWDSDFTSAKFIGNGIGEFSFNTFRKIHFNNKTYFEKVYFTNSQDLLKISWFHENVAPILRGSLNFAKLDRMIKGDIITIVYFEFVELVAMSREQLDPIAFDISRRLIEITNSSRVKELEENTPDYLKDFKLHAYYKGNIGFATKMIKQLSDNRLSPAVIEELINLQPTVLTHGDIQETNLFANSYLIDWDSFGFFPIGFETSYILCKSNVILSKVEGTLRCIDLQSIIVDNYKTLISEDQWASFELSCLYFYFVFIAMDQSLIPEMSLQKEIFARIEQLYNDIIKTHSRQPVQLSSFLRESMNQASESLETQ